MTGSEIVMDGFDSKLGAPGEVLEVCKTVKLTRSVGQSRKVQRKGREAGIADFKRLFSDKRF